jgi:hypothetical protein
MQEFKGTRPQGEVDAAETGTTRATARLPGLDIEIMHWRAVEGHAEQISINLRAVPSFEAFGRALEAATRLRSGCKPRNSPVCRGWRWRENSRRHCRGRAATLRRVPRRGRLVGLSAQGERSDAIQSQKYCCARHHP